VFKYCYLFVVILNVEQLRRSRPTRYRYTKPPLGLFAVTEPNRTE